MARVATSTPIKRIRIPASLATGAKGRQHGQPERQGGDGHQHASGVAEEPEPVSKPDDGDHEHDRTADQEQAKACSLTLFDRAAGIGCIQAVWHRLSARGSWPGYVFDRQYNAGSRGL
jgi:hypothetical protein